MSTSIKLPQWGMSMSEGTLIDWMVEEGDAVTEGQELAEVEAAKVTNTIVSPTDGVMGPRLVAVDEVVAVNTVLCEILTETEARDGGSAAPPASAETNLRSSNGEPASALASAPAVPDGIERDPDRARAVSGRVTGVVPLARKLAKEAELDLATVTGTGKHGRIVAEDVRKAIVRRDAGSAPTAPADAIAVPALTASSRPAGEDAEEIPLSNMRSVIAERMHASLLNTAQLTLTTTVDVTAFAHLRSTVGAGARRPRYVDAVIRAVALALRDHPRLSARLDGDRIIQGERIDIGMAVAVEDGLLVPVVKEADTLGLPELSEATRNLAQRARDGGLSAQQLEGGTFSVTSLGGQGIDMFTPILNPPQSAILGIGRSREVPIRYGEGIAWRQQMTLSLTHDHRVVDGYPAALFLQHVVSLLEEPRRLL